LLLVAATAVGYFVLKPSAAPTDLVAADLPKYAMAASVAPSAADSRPMAAVSMPASDPVAASMPAPAVVVAASGPSADEIEQQAWDDALKFNTAAAFEAYLKGYPKGRYAAR